MRFFSSSKGRIHYFPIAFLVFVVALVVGGIFPVQGALAASPYLMTFPSGQNNLYDKAQQPRPKSLWCICRPK